MGVLVTLVLRSGGVYQPSHVQSLKRHVEANLPGADVVCLSDVAIEGVRTIPLKHRWPGWWSKIELFRPDIRGDFLYLDLDTVVTGDLSDIASVGRLTMLSDFYRPERPASGVMFLPEGCRAKVWDHWMKSPQAHMARCGTLGDQKFLGDVFGQVDRFQNLLPRQVFSYKVHVCTPQQSKRGIGNGSIPENARIVCFHGNPRPWQVTLNG